VCRSHALHAPARKNWWQSRTPPILVRGGSLRTRMIS
jgi:hypothetical protein